jgi:hypothetical protein
MDSTSFDDSEAAQNLIESFKTEAPDLPRKCGRLYNKCVELFASVRNIPIPNRRTLHLLIRKDFLRRVEELKTTNPDIKLRMKSIVIGVFRNAQRKLDAEFEAQKLADTMRNEVGEWENNL